MACLAWLVTPSIFQGLEGSISRIAIELDEDLRPDFVREVVQLPAHGDGQEQRLRLLFHSQLGNATCVRKRLRGAAERERTGNSRRSARILAEHGATQGGERG